VFRVNAIAVDISIGNARGIETSAFQFAKNNFDSIRFDSRQKIDSNRFELIQFDSFRSTIEGGGQIDILSS